MNKYLVALAVVMVGCVAAPEEAILPCEVSHSQTICCGTVHEVAPPTDSSQNCGPTVNLDEVAAFFLQTYSQVTITGTVSMPPRSVVVHDTCPYLGSVQIPHDFVMSPYLGSRYVSCTLVHPTEGQITIMTEEGEFDAPNLETFCTAMHDAGVTAYSSSSGCDSHCAREIVACEY